MYSMYDGASFPLITCLFSFLAEQCSSFFSYEGLSSTMSIVVHSFSSQPTNVRDVHCGEKKRNRDFGLTSGNKFNGTLFFFFFFFLNRL